MQYVIDLNAVTQTFVSSDGSPVTALQGVDLHLAHTGDLAGVANVWGGCRQKRHAPQCGPHQAVTHESAGQIA